MINTVLSSITYVIENLFNFFLVIVRKVEADGIVIGAFLVLTIYRFLLLPISGGSAGRSDTVKKPKVKKESGEDG